MRRAASGVLAATLATTTVGAHDGPPFPIVSDRTVGAYLISVWTDPDTTDDGSPGGQFWVRIDAARGGGRLPETTRASVAIRPLDRGGPSIRAEAEPVRGDVTNQFAALLMDHEGRFAVHVAVDGPLGAATLDSEVSATYDARPPPALLALYLAPFVAVGLLWARVLISRRGERRASSARAGP
jgi:hypothetical protein